MSIDTFNIIRQNIRNFSPEKESEVYSIIDLSYYDLSAPHRLTLIETKTVQDPIIDLEQAYFWTEDWQKDERMIEEDYKQGKFKKFSNPKDAIAYLHE